MNYHISPGSICVYLRLIIFLSLRALAPKTIRVYPVNPVKYKITIKPTQKQNRKAILFLLTN